MNKKLLITLILALIFFSPPKKAISRIFGHKSNLISVVGKAQHKKLDPKNLNILVWNIKKAENPYFIDDYRGLASNHQIVLIQEGIFSEDVIRDYLKLPGYQAVIAKSFHLPFGSPEMFTGVTTISKAPSIKNMAIKTFFKEPVAKTPKMTLFTKYPIKGSKKSLLVVNIHAINFVSNKTFKFEISRLKARMILHLGPIIWAGDFNTWSSSRLQHIKKVIKHLKLKEINFPSHFRDTGWGLILDHAFIRGAKLLSIKNLNHINTSDHKPLSFEISIDPEN